MKYNALFTVEEKHNPNHSLTFCSTGKSRICVGVETKYDFSIHFCFSPQTSLVKCFFAVYNRRVQRAFFFEKPQKRKAMKKQVHDPGAPLSPAAGETNTVPSPEEKEEKKKQRGRPYVEGCKNDNCTTR
jgi:hypothetical protein